MTGKSSALGLTLVEILISLTLLGLISFSFMTFISRSSLMTASVRDRFGAVLEVQTLLFDLRKDLAQGAYISNNSHNQRLEYTTYDVNGDAVKKIYRILLSGGSYYLQLSTDGGTVWGTPYRISDYTKYVLKGTPKFLYAGSVNNCTDFNDSTADGVWVSGVDTAGVYVSCSNGTSTPVLSLPSQATKVVLENFEFSTGSGVPETNREIPDNVFVAAPAGLVRSTVAPAAPAVKDPPLVQAFDTATTNSLFGTPFDIRCATWDRTHQRLALVGNHSSGNHIFYLADRKGVRIGSPFTTSVTTIQATSAAFMSGGNSILLLDSAAKKLYQFSLSATASISAVSTLDLASPTNLINSPTAIAFDAGTPDDFYIVGTDPSTAGLKIYQRNILSGALVGTAWNLPGAFTVSDPPGGLSLDPVTGDFFVVRNQVNGLTPNRTIDIYRINRSTGTSTSFSVNLDDLGSTATGTAGNWGLGYDPASNRLFLSDSVTDKVYEVVPNVRLSIDNS